MQPHKVPTMVDLQFDAPRVLRVHHDHYVLQRVNLRSTTESLPRGLHQDNRHVLLHHAHHGFLLHVNHDQRPHAFRLHALRFRDLLRQKTVH